MLEYDLTIDVMLLVENDAVTLADLRVGSTSMERRSAVCARAVSIGVT